MLTLTHTTRYQCKILEQGLFQTAYDEEKSIPWTSKFGKKIVI